MSEINQYINIDPNDRIVCVNISSTYDKNERENDYDRARHYWKVSLDKANKANLVLATVHGIVKAVFKPIRWYLTDSTIYPGTYEFEGEQIFDSPYIGKCVWNVVNKYTVTFSYINI